MQKLVEGIIGKRMTAVFFDGKVLESGSAVQNIVPHENWTPYVITEDEAQAKELFADEKNKVVYGNKQTVEISEKWSPFTVCAPKSYTEFIFYAQRLTEMDGVMIYSYENLFSNDDIAAMKKHFEVCRDVLGLRNKQHVQEDGKRYLIATRTSVLLAAKEEFEKNFLPLFMGPVIDVDVTRVVFKSKPYWNHPYFFREIEPLEWKNDYFFTQQTCKDAFFKDIGKPKFLGGAIEVPNHEQVTVLIASGAINSEIILDDGRIVTLKGTESVSTKERVKMDLEGNPKAFVEQKVRQTLVYGLDMTNGEFFKLSSGE